MSQKINLEQEPCFILHRKFYSDESVWMDCLTRNHGRVCMLARGAQRPSSIFGKSLTLFQPLVVRASGVGLFRVVSVEHICIFPFLTGRKLWAALYMNELILSLFPRGDNCQDLFTLYCDTLEGIAFEQSEFFDTTLRRFEIAFLGILGYSLNFSLLHGGEVIPEDLYTYVVGEGLYHGSASRSDGATLSGWSVTDLSHGLSTVHNSNEIRQLMRYVIDYYMNGNVLKTRKMLQYLLGK